MSRKPRTRQRPVCLLPLPKCASSSVLAVLRAWQNTWSFLVDFDHVSQQKLAATQVQELTTTGWWFTFVRNPWARVISAWQMYEQRPLFRSGVSRTLDDVLRLIVEFDWSAPLPAEPWPQAELSRDCYLQQHLSPLCRLPLSRAHFIGQVESIKDDWNTVQDCTGIRVGLPRENQSKHKHYRDYYTPEQRELVSRVYREDIERFDYSY